MILKDQLDDDTGEVAIGAVVCWTQCSSFTDNSNILKEDTFLGESEPGQAPKGKRTVFQTMTFGVAGIQDYSNYPKESEFLFPSMTRFVIVKVTRWSDNVTEVQLRQLMDDDADYDSNAAEAEDLTVYDDPDDYLSPPGGAGSSA